MAYITQYEADMQGNARNAQNQAAIGNALTNFANSLEENRKRALETKRANDAQDLQLAAGGASAEDIKNYRATGDAKNIFDKYAAIAEAKRKKDLADAEANKALKESQVDKNKAQAEYYQNGGAYGSNGKMGDKEKIDYQETLRQNAEKRKLENEKAQGLQKAAIPDFEIANPNVIPSSQDAEKVKASNEANKNFAIVGEKINDRLGKLDWKDRTGLTNNWNQLQQDLTEMQMQAKNLYDLGVLNGPDLSLVNKGLGSLDVVTLNRLGPEAAQERIKQAIESAQQKLMNAASARGYKQKSQPMQAPQNQQQPIDERQELEMLRQMKNQRMAGR